MPDRYAFTSPFGKEPKEPWFKVQNFGITTTIGFIALAILALFWRTVEGRPYTLFRKLTFNPSSITEGEIWRLVTWPFPNDPHILLVVSLFFLYIIGTQLEDRLGKKSYLILVCSLVLLPALLTVVASFLLSGSASLINPTIFMTGIIVAYAANKPKALFFFSIPAWAIAGVIVAIDLMRSIGDNLWIDTIFTLTMVLVALVMVRALGYAAPELDVIPRIPLGPLASADASLSSSGRKRKKRNLYSVPTPLEEAEMNTILDQISDSGYKSLSSEQKKKLKKYSKNMRNREEGLS